MLCALLSVQCEAEARLCRKIKAAILRIDMGGAVHNVKNPCISKVIEVFKYLCVWCSYADVQCCSCPDGSTNVVGCKAKIMCICPTDQALQPRNTTKMGGIPH